ETGNVQPRRIPGRAPKKVAALQEHIHELLQTRSDASLEDYCQMWESQQGVKVSPSTMGRAIRRAGYTRKKRHWVLLNAIKKHGLPGKSNSSTLMRTSSW